MLIALPITLLYYILLGLWWETKYEKEKDKDPLKIIWEIMELVKSNAHFVGYPQN